MIIVTTSMGDFKFNGPDLEYKISDLGILHVRRGSCTIASFREWLHVNNVFDTEA